MLLIQQPTYVIAIVLLPLLLQYTFWCCIVYEITVRFRHRIVIPQELTRVQSTEGFCVRPNKMAKPWRLSSSGERRSFVRLVGKKVRLRSSQPTIDVLKATVTAMAAVTRIAARNASRKKQ